MENYSHQSYPDSGESSPLSREIDCENPASWDEPPSSAAANYKVKFMCSYGGKIQPRSHDNQLSYVGGDTKILSIERNAPFSAFLSKLASISASSDICFKYQLPDEDLDALISVTNDEDLEHMMLEFDRLTRSSPKPARLRIFLFTATSNSNSEEYHHFNKEAPKPEGSWFVDALNSAQHRSSPPPPPPPNPEPSPPDFLFGLDKAAPIINNKNNNSKVPDQAVAAAVGEPASFMQTQMERFRIGEGEMHKSYEELNNPNPLNSPTMYQTEYYSKVQEAPPQGFPVPISAGYWPERGQVVASGIPADQHQQQQPVYVVQHHTGGGAYHQNPSVGQIPGAGQAYYSVPRAVAETYRDQHAAVPPQPSSLIQQHAVVGGMQDGMGMGMGMVRQPPMVSTEQGYAQVSYVDSSGRPVYYTMAGGGLPLPPPQYQMMTTAAAAGVDGRAVGGLGMGLDAKAVAGKPPQTSSV